MRRFSMVLVLVLLAAGCGGGSGDYDLSAEEAACVGLYDEWPEEAAREGLVPCLENRERLPILPPPKPDFLTVTSDLDPEDAYCRTRVWQHEVVVNPDMWGWESDPEGYADEIAAVRVELERCFDDNYYEVYGSRIRRIAAEVYRDYRPTTTRTSPEVEAARDPANDAQAFADAEQWVDAIRAFFEVVARYGEWTDRSVAEIGAIDL